ncbi:LacI family DNA-binding transcriptional regulator [Paracidobacterium acidisoli]|nr:LacI family DNA-binding transcriptional regulator [Paracidobacterium acidisoli]MBT9330516.1 LacI family transcriptional regulator [Paracidobacterium acidisoli]
MKRKSSHPTLSDVAQRAGVGTTTVSRVINGGKRVSPKTLARIRAIIDQIGYTPNQAARILKGERTRTIGLVIPSIADSFFASCAEAAQRITRAHDSMLVVAVTGNDPHVEMENINALMRHRADGLLLAPANSQNEALAAFLERTPIPVVCIDRPVTHSGVASVGIDNFKGARIAVEHLVGHGYRRILCLGGETTLYTIRERLRGYRQAMTAAGLEPMEDMSVKDYKSAEHAIESHLAATAPPDAIFTVKNSTTIYAFETLQKMRVDIPKTVALLGFDDFELAATLRPSISVVQQPIEDIGRTAAELLFTQLPAEQPQGSSRAKRPAPARKTGPVRLEPLLVLRESCGCARAAL